MSLFPATIRNVGIFSPAGYPKEPSIVTKAVDRLQKEGVTAVWPRGTLTQKRFFAGTDEQRAESLKLLLEDPEVDALMALKGGYGTARFLECVDWNLMRSRNLPVIGYSDVTALHLAALKHGCRNHFYGPMLASTFGLKLETDEQNDAFQKTLESLSAALAGASELLTFGKEAVRILKRGRAEGPLVPVCLSVMTSLIGTSYLPELKNHILAIEDINEPAHRIDRYLNQLRQAGILGKLSGLVFGSFANAEDGEYLDDIMEDYARYINGPVVEGVHFGHVLPALTLPVGTEVLLDTTTDDILFRRSRFADYQSQMAVSSTGQTLGYRWLEPRQIEVGRRYPLVLFLHGAGERGEDNACQLVHVLPKFIEEGVREQFPCFVAAPQCPAGQQWVNTPWGNLSHSMAKEPSEAMTAVVELLDELALDYPIDLDRVYLMGISMGGYGVWELLSRFPCRYAAAVPICGGADLNKAEQIATTPVWAFHGDSDSTVPVSRTRDIVVELHRLGASVRYTEFPGCGHNSWTPACQEQGLLSWMFSQVRGRQ